MQSRISALSRAALLAGLLVLLPVNLSAEEHHAHGARGHGTTVPGSVIYYYPYDYGWAWDWGYYDPYWSYPYGFYQSNTGTIKLKDVDKHDQVFVNGSFAGNAGKLKSMDLPPGTYTLEVKHANRDVINERVYVTTGKTVKLNVGDRVS